MKADEIAKSKQLTTNASDITAAKPVGPNGCKMGFFKTAKILLAGIMQRGQIMNPPKNIIAPLPIIAAARNPMIVVRAFPASINNKA